MSYGPEPPLTDEQLQKMIEIREKRMQEVKDEKRMELRDRFAIAALQGMLGSGNNGRPEWFANLAYDYADAMLKER